MPKIEKLRAKLSIVIRKRPWCKLRYSCWKQTVPLWLVHFPQKTVSSLWQPRKTASTSSKSVVLATRLTRRTLISRTERIPPLVRSCSMLMPSCWKEQPLPVRQQRWPSRKTPLFIMQLPTVPQREVLLRNWWRSYRVHRWTMMVRLPSMVSRCVRSSLTVGSSWPVIPRQHWRTCLRTLSITSVLMISRATWHVLLVFRMVMRRPCSTSVLSQVWTKVSSVMPI